MDQDRGEVLTGASVVPYHRPVSNYAERNSARSSLRRPAVGPVAQQGPIRQY
jgi:hypothetical protein